MNDYDALPAWAKTVKVVAGLAPPLATLYWTGSIWKAVAVFVFGLVAGNLYSRWYIGNVMMRTGSAEQAVKASLAAFLWAPPIAGAAAAIFAIYFWS